MLDKSELEEEELVVYYSCTSGMCMDREDVVRTLKDLEFNKIEVNEDQRWVKVALVEL